MAVRRISSLHPFDFEEPEGAFSTASRGLDRFSRARSRLGVIFPIAVKKVFISVELKSKYFAASCAKARWGDACVAEYLHRSFEYKPLAIRRSSFYTLSILRNQKRDLQLSHEVWISFQEPEAVWGVIFPTAVNKVFISVDLK